HSSPTRQPRYAQLLRHSHAAHSVGCTMSGKQLLEIEPKEVDVLDVTNSRRPQDPLPPSPKSIASRSISPFHPLPRCAGGGSGRGRSKNCWRSWASRLSSLAFATEDEI